MVIELYELLDNLSERTKVKFEKQPSVINKGDAFDVKKLPIDKAEWHAIDDVVSVNFDMKASTNLAKGRSPQSTASIYDAGVGGVVKIFQEFDAQFVDIQGDGGFALFWGNLRYERAVSSAVTARTFSIDFTEQLENKWPKASSTGFKLGVASGSLMAKRVGLPRHLDLQEPVWAGNPVNYAAKAAQQAVDVMMNVTGSVWDAISNNDYLTFSCDCGNPALLWDSVILDKIPDDEKFGFSLNRHWCRKHGEDYCRQVLAGKVTRVNIPDNERHKRTLLANASTELVAAAKSRANQRNTTTTLFASLGS
ncbi:hypothetical protein [Plantibacter sp. CFBP 8804]|uniref:hypothetical protein n=1 Tax=Plantibacter sp. CFBP 8804 TaxID=2775270 RepID=UPI001785F08D|nr:hypothetical protein [Plantibacter sp. CFBP 8804]MBD8519218.1 hypothetical protein [Plantibacter sp. CFBP 8804]